MTIITKATCIHFTMKSIEDAYYPGKSYDKLEQASSESNNELINGLLTFVVVGEFKIAIKLETGESSLTRYQLV